MTSHACLYNRHFKTELMAGGSWIRKNKNYLSTQTNVIDEYALSLLPLEENNWNAEESRMDESWALFRLSCLFAIQQRADFLIRWIRTRPILTDHAILKMRQNPKPDRQKALTRYMTSQAQNRLRWAWNEEGKQNKRDIGIKLTRWEWTPITLACQWYCF